MRKGDSSTANKRPRLPEEEEGKRTARLSASNKKPRPEQPSSGRERPATDSTSGRLNHPFRANFNDHFETSPEALRDVLPAVEELRQLTRPSAPSAFTLYDPYYCSGTVVSHWASLGFPQVLHENRDFYQDIKAGTVPGPYDMLVTNPPFSDDHIQRMMHFLISLQDKPWAFLAPDYIVSKPWYRELVRRHFTPAPPTGKGRLTASGQAAPAQRVSGPVAFELPPFLRAALEKERVKDAAEALPSSTPAESSEGEGNGTAKKDKGEEKATPSKVVGLEPFYIIPKGRYDFKHPAGAGKDHSHFKSIWYVWPGRRLPEVLRATTVALRTRRSASSDTAAPAVAVAVVHGLQALDEGKYVTATERRLNPQRRQQQQQQHGHLRKGR